MGVNRDQCLTDCARWDRANHICLAQAENCDEIQACFVSCGGTRPLPNPVRQPKDALRKPARRNSFPPDLTDNCTADCFRDTPSPRDVEEFESLSCREVREFVLYRENRELRPSAKVIVT